MQADQKCHSQNQLRSRHIFPKMSNQNVIKIVDIFPQTWHNCHMTQTYKPYTIDELVTLIYEDNLEHFEQSTEDCDCHIHITIRTVVKYWDE